MSKRRRLEVAVKNAAKKIEKVEREEWQPGYYIYTLANGNTMYIDHLRRKALLHIPTNETGMGGNAITVEIARGIEEVYIPGPFFYNYEDACNLCDIK